MEIRTATRKDTEAIREIYAPYVMNTAISFEYEVPETDEFRRRIENTLKKYPYIVAVDNGHIVGYAYAGAFRTRAAYSRAAELSVYVDKDYRKHGIGRALYNELMRILALQNVCTVHACITNTDREDDEYLTRDSELFHQKMGFTFAGKHIGCGLKFGKWYNIIWMDKKLITKDTPPGNFIPFPNLKI